tara:strand:- start:490 stop:1179 length:690 start_codon:yes stop_codon:yes gene_type:complete
MINLKDFIFTVDDILTDSECDFIINDFGKGRVYKEHCFESNSTEVRESTVDMTSLVPNTEAFNLAHNATNRLIHEYSQYLKELDFIWVERMMCDLTYSHNYRLMRYSEGQSIHDHVDKFWNIFGSATLALNDGYDGGLFRFFKGKHKIKTKKRQGMIWPAENYFVHGVAPITEGTRWSVNSFLGMEECVTEDNRNEYGSNFWYHEATRPYNDRIAEENIKFDKLQGTTY